MSKSLRPPVASFTSAKRRRFTVGPGKHDERFPGDTLWTDEFPILYKGKAAGKLFRSLSYGTGPTGEPRWHASTRALYWTYASGAEQAGIGYDVAAFDTARECLAAWGHSADQILDWHQSHGGKTGGGKSAARPAATRKSGRPRRPRVAPAAKVRPAEAVVRRAEPGYTITDARYAKGQKLIKVQSSGTGTKTRAERLACDGLKGRYTDREDGYVLSPAKAARFEELFAKGWDACTVTQKLEPPEGYAAEVAPAKAARPRRTRVAEASPVPRSRIPAAAIEKAREESPGKYPLPIAEQKLAGLYDYVKREGGKLPPCGK